MRILSQARTESFKGLQYLVEAFHQILKLRENIEVVFFGFKDPKIKAIPYTFIKFPKGDQLAKLYSSVDVYVLSSLAESFPLTPLEAMACGTPVVTTRYGTEDYCFNEVNSLVVSPKDPRALANAILRLLDNEELREKFRKEGPKTAKRFTCNKTADKFEELFKNDHEKYELVKLWRS
jgi:glycosyltransferase involved in cell wall biosynthesis